MRAGGTAARGGVAPLRRALPRKCARAKAARWAISAPPRPLLGRRGRLRDATAQGVSSGRERRRASNARVLTIVSNLYAMDTHNREENSDGDASSGGPCQAVAYASTLLVRRDRWVHPSRGAARRGGQRHAWLASDHPVTRVARRRGRRPGALRCRRPPPGRRRGCGASLARRARRRRRPSG